MNFLKKTLLVATLFFSVFALSSCNEQKKEIEFNKTGNPDSNISIGELDGNNYKNDYFGLKITFPEGMYPKPSEEMLKMSGLSQDLINKGINSEDVLKNVENMIPLAFAYDRKEIFTNDTVGSVIVMAQKITDENKEFFTSPSEYLRLTIKSLESNYNDMGLNNKYKIEESVPVSINNKEFHVARVKIDLSDGLFMNQEFYVIYTNGYALFMTTTYYDEAQKALIDQTVNSLTLE